MSEQNDTNSVNTKLIITIVCVIVFIIFGLYFCKFAHFGLSTDNAKWGTFGDYIGGILNPIIAGFVFYYVVKTYELEKKQLGDKEKELEATQTQLKNQTHISAFAILVNSKLMEISDLRNKLNEAEKELAIFPDKVRNGEYHGKDSEAIRNKLEKDVKDSKNEIDSLKQDIKTLEENIKEICNLEINTMFKLKITT